MARSPSNAADPTAREPSTGVEPGKEFDSDWHPTSLPDLIAGLMEREGYTKLQPLVNARKSRISYSTIWSWYTSARNKRRAPTRKVLRMFAEDFHLPLNLVLHAAGLTIDEELELEEDEIVLLHLYKELPQQDKEFAEQMLRNLAERTHNTTGHPKLDRSAAFS